MAGYQAHDRRQVRSGSARVPALRPNSAPEQPTGNEHALQSRTLPLQRMADRLSARSGNQLIQRMSNGQGVTQFMRPHDQDANRHFQLRYPNGNSDPIVGTYIGPADADRYRFATSRGEIVVHHDRILGYRPTVGGLHMEGRVRPPEDNVSGRDQVFLSEADLSGAMARQRQDPSMANRMVATTFEQTPNYAHYAQNRRDLEVLGVPILNNMDIADTGATAARLSGVGPDANLHFQMPRVPMGTPNYSTPRLIQDTLRLPSVMQRPDMTVSVTAPQPSAYGRGKKGIGTHNSRYSLENGNALENTGMHRVSEGTDDELEAYGYEHRQTTVDASTGAAAKRRKYKFAPHSEHPDFHKFFPKPKEDDDDSGGGGRSGDTSMISAR